jgi:mRNA interferase MazF
VAAVLNGNDLILCQITSKNRNDSYSVPLSDSDQNRDAIKVESVIRPNRIFTAEKSIILYRIGKVNPDKAKEVEDVLVRIFKGAA